MRGRQLQERPGGPGAGLLSMVGIAIVLLYRLNKQAHVRILTDLNARRAAPARAAS